MAHSLLFICAFLLASSMCKSEWALGPIELPNILTTLQGCPDNEMGSICHECERSCGETEESSDCAASCSPGCICKQGMIRQNGYCIPKEKCHPKGSS